MKSFADILQSRRRSASATSSTVQPMVTAAGLCVASTRPVTAHFWRQTSARSVGKRSSRRHATALVGGFCLATASASLTENGDLSLPTVNAEKKCFYLSM